MKIIISKTSKKIALRDIRKMSEPITVDVREVLTVNDVREALIAVTKNFGDEVAMKILDDVGDVTALSKLKPEKFGAVTVAAYKKAIAKWN
jgi:hypothetical protein